MDPLVSVVVTFHNQSPFVAPAIETVLRQRYPNLETIVVDDGSTDDTRRRCLAFGDRVRLIARANGGPSAARNSGITEARGEYVAHLDGNDLWNPDKIARQVEVAKRFPGAGMIVANGHMFGEGMPTIPGLIWGDVGRRLAATSEPAILLDPYRALIRRHCFNTPSQMMIPASVCRAVGAWDERIKLVAEVELALRIAARYPSAFMRGDLVGYRLLEGSLSWQFAWALDTFGVMRRHARIAPPTIRPALEARMAGDANHFARDAYYLGRRGRLAWALRYQLRLLAASRRAHRVLPYLAALLLPERLVSAAARRVRRVRRPGDRGLNPETK
jgi:glycosyltransferase involved in cell wall biosynthesis